MDAGFSGDVLERGTAVHDGVNIDIPTPSGRFLASGTREHDEHGTAEYRRRPEYQVEGRPLGF